MADTNQESQQLAETLAKLREAFDGSEAAVRKRTDAEMKAKYGIENFSAGTEKAAGVLGALGGAGMAAAKAMNQGQKGAAAFNGAVDGMADAAKMAGAALTLMIPGGPAIKLLIAGITASVAAYAEFTKAANEMSDTLYKGYQGLAKSGGAASDGMTGLYKDAKKLGLGLNELDSLVSLVAENSADFARFAGSVSDGRKRFAELGAAMKPQTEAMIRMGMMPEQINEAMAGYLRTQTRLGNAQRMTTDQLAEGARNYLREQDALTKITGQSVKETEKKREDALMEEQFAAKIRQLQLNNQHDAAKRLMLMNDAASAMSEELGKGLRAAATNNLTNAAAQKLYLSTQGQIFPALNAVIAGTKSPAEALDSVTDKIIETNDKIGVHLGILGVNDKTYIAIGEAAKIRAAKESGNMADRMKAAEKDYDARLKGGTDPLLDSAAELRTAQIDANKATNDFIVNGIVPATEAMTALANATAAAAKAITPERSQELRTNKRTGTEQDKDGYYEYEQYQNEAFGGRSGGSLEATGKFIEDFGTGTPMMLHGREGVITEAQLNSLIKSAVGAGAGSMSSLKAKQKSDTATVPASNQISQLQNLQTEMLKDTEELAKITDRDLSRTREFTRTNLKLMDLKTDLMEDEIELLEEQNKMLSDMEEMYSKIMGPEAAKAAVKAFKRTQMAGGMGGMGSMPSPAPAGGGPSAPTEVEGARYGTNKKAADLLQFTGASGSASAFEGLNSRLKDSVIAAAEEYYAATGNRMQVNSAKRDPADQERLWNDSVARGTPGRGPTGMAVAPPGRSPHEKGLAIDIQNYNDPAAVAAMNRQGLKQKVPGDPVHFSFGDGGIANGPRSGYLAELHGPEAVVPLPDGKTIPVRIEGGDQSSSRAKDDMADMMRQFKSSMESMINQMNNRDLLNMMDEMVRAQKTSNGIQEKLLRAAAN
jgi:hypothetical protein